MQKIEIPPRMLKQESNLDDDDLLASIDQSLLQNELESPAILAQRVELKRVSLTLLNDMEAPK